MPRLAGIALNPTELTLAMKASGATEFRLAQHELEASALRAQVLERCRRTLHHDVNNAVQSIHSGLELLSKCVDKPNVAQISPQECIALLQQQFVSLRNTLAKVIGDIAAPPGEPERIDLGQLVQEVVALLRHEAPIYKATMHLEAGVATDARLVPVRTFILALMLDALDRLAENQSLEFRVGTAAGHAELQIRTLGANTAEAHESALVELVTRVADAEGARISVTREDDQRVVSLSLPHAAAAAPATGEPKPLCVVIADRNRDAADSLAMIVRLEGHQALAAYDGNGLRELLRTQPADVVLLDADLPGCDVREAAQEARALVSAPLLIYVSNASLDHPADFDARLAHPIEWPALQQLLEERAAE
jgi:CheY-like chemotaxis protein